MSDPRIQREAALMAATDKAFGRPVTRDMLIEDLRNLGLENGDTVLVHSSLSSLGWVMGHAGTVIAALTDVLGEKGTLVMPTHSTDLSDPDPWEFPPVPDHWKPLIRAGMPAFDVFTTASRGMGAVPELFRLLPGVLRSLHPTVSFAARGPHAGFVTGNHSLEDGLGEGGPLARIYDLDGKVLLLGVKHGNNTSLHLAEYRAQWPGKKNHVEHSPMIRDGRRLWVEYSELDIDEDDFSRCGEAWESSADFPGPGPGKVGLAESRLFRQRPMVDFAVTWMENNRPESLRQNTGGTEEPDAT